MLATPPTLPLDLTAKVTTGLSALLTSAAFSPTNELGFIRVTGEDRVRWLNGMVTNSIQTLLPGQGCYNFFLNAQGRIQGDATAWMLEDSILLETARDRVPGLIALLDRFIIMDDVELTPAPTSGFRVVGPRAAEILASIGFIVPSETLRMVRRQNTGDELIHAYSPLVPRFEIWTVSPQQATRIVTALVEQGTEQATEGDLEALRLLEGTPRYGMDIREKDLPQETAQTRALHFAKGCYLGQEIVERIRSRGNVHRTFAGFVLNGALPATGAPIQTADTSEKAVGEITSAAQIDLPSGSIKLALGFIRREALEAVIAGRTALTYEGGTASPVALPYASQT